MSDQNKTDNEMLNQGIHNYVPNTSPRTCPGCDGKGWQVRTSDGIKITCPMCSGSGIFLPAGTITFTSIKRSCPRCPKENSPAPYNGIPYQPWSNRDYYVGDDPAEWNGPPRVICYQ